MNTFVIQELMIRLQIGKESNNDPYTINLPELPHLFVAYSEKEQLEKMFHTLLQQMIPDQSLLAYAGPWRILQSFIPPLPLWASFRRDPEKISTAQSRMDFIKSLHDELKLRERSSKKEGLSHLKPLVIFMDDLLDLVITRQKKTGTFFLDLFQKGPSLKIYFIIASIRSYRNLIGQLLAQVVQNPQTPAFRPGKGPSLEQLAGELVITPEDLLFYKSPGEMNYKTLYLLSEGCREQEP